MEAHINDILIVVSVYAGLRDDLVQCEHLLLAMNSAVSVFAGNTFKIVLLVSGHHHPQCPCWTSVALQGVSASVSLLEVGLLSSPHTSQFWRNVNPPAKSQNKKSKLKSPNKQRSSSAFGAYLQPML